MPDAWQCAAAAAVAGGTVAIVDLVRSFTYIKTPTDAPSAADLGLPAAFSKLLNVRDVGASPSTVGMHGRPLRRGLLYRSAKLSGMTARDQELLLRMGLRSVADFRARDEAASEPDVFASGHDVAHRFFEAADGDPRAMMTQVIRDGSLSPAAACNMMTDLYRGFVTSHSHHFRSFLETLARQENLPALVHCTAGKDRTGWATALLLFILGVPEDAIFQDFLLSNKLWYRQARKYMLLIRLTSGFRIHPEAAKQLMVVRLEYLQASIDAACASHGSVTAYISAADGLGLTPTVISQLQDIFLDEPPTSKM